MADRDGAKKRLRPWIEANVGRVVTTAEIMAVGRASSSLRRFRELREKEGYQILSHNDRDDLRPDQYILVTLERLPQIDEKIPPRLRNEILERNGFTCQLCGAGPGDPDPCNPSRKVRLHIDHIRPATQHGRISRGNLRTLCSSCNQVRANIQAPSESAKNLLARIRRQPRSVQREVYDALKRSFAPPPSDSADPTGSGA